MLIMLKFSLYQVQQNSLQTEELQEVDLSLNKH